MKKLLTVFVFMLFIQFSFAQETVGERVIKNAKDKTYGRGEQKGDETVDKTLNKVEEKITNLFKKKEKKKKETEQQEDSSEQSSDENQETQSPPSSSQKSVKSNSNLCMHRATLSHLCPTEKPKFKLRNGSSIWEISSIWRFPQKGNSFSYESVVLCGPFSSVVLCSLYTSVVPCGLYTFFVL